MCRILVEREVTTLLVTHDQDQAFALAHQIGVINDAVNAAVVLVAVVTCTVSPWFFSRLHRRARTISRRQGVIVAGAERQAFADAFSACGGLQCGFCIPGIVMRAKAQIDKKGADLTREKMAPHLGAHLCRCTGYVKVLDAIEAVAGGAIIEVSGGITIEHTPGH